MAPTRRTADEPLWTEKEIHQHLARCRQPPATSPDPWPYPAANAHHDADGRRRLANATRTPLQTQRPARPHWMRRREPPQALYLSPPSPTTLGKTSSRPYRLHQKNEVARKEDEENVHRRRVGVNPLRQRRGGAVEQRRIERPPREEVHRVHHRGGGGVAAVAAAQALTVADAVGGWWCTARAGGGVQAADARANGLPREMRGVGRGSRHPNTVVTRCGTTLGCGERSACAVDGAAASYASPATGTRAAGGAESGQPRPAVAARWGSAELTLWPAAGRAAAQADVCAAAAPSKPRTGPAGVTVGGVASRPPFAANSAGSRAAVSPPISLQRPRGARARSHGPLTWGAAPAARGRSRPPAAVCGPARPHGCPGGRHKT